MRLTREARAAARRFRPDVVFAHFLFPAGAAGALAARAAGAPLVVMAHGQDVANLGRIPGVTTATRWVLGRSSAVIANSRWLAGRLAEQIPAAESKTEVADCGVDLEAFSPRPADEARRELDWDGAGPAFLCVGSLIERKNVVRWPRPSPPSAVDDWPTSATGRCGPTRGPTRCHPRRSDPAGRTSRDGSPPADVLCQPSLIEPFGQATFEGMAMERTVVATTVGGPPSSSHPKPGC